MNPPIEWLLQGDSWVEFRTRVDLLGQSECDEEVLLSRQFMVKDPKIKTIVSELSGWPCVVISSHKSAGQPFHKLTFLADLGLKANDVGMDTIIPRILKHQSQEGPFQLPMTILPQYGGSGNEQWGWALCDAPLVVYALIKFGLEKDPQVQLAIDYMAGLLCDNGWRCVGSKELGNFRGPGRKDDPCPFATLAMLKALSESIIWKDSQACHVGAETLLTLWAESDNR
ncbi:MAG TPA: hypothetical protein PLZ51_19205, partial [Aggregatilineales bacterium]|nr:hypothetical protein [Aggregatilineales bacterium]